MRSSRIAAAAALALSLGGGAAWFAVGGGTPGEPGAAPTPTTTASPEPTPTRAGPPSQDACGSGGAVVAWRVEVERGSGVGRDTFARAVRNILCDERSWIASGVVRFRYDPQGDTLIGLRTPDGTERRCMQMIGLSVNRYYSCAASAAKEAVINADRWNGGADAFPGPLGMYRRMLINHEVGHVLTLRHVNCPAEGAPAPVMMQQSKGMNLNGLTCRPNPWPTSTELDRLRSVRG